MAAAELLKAPPEKVIAAPASAVKLPASGPPPLNTSVPVCAVTVPELGIGIEMVVVPAPADLTSVPAL